MAEPTINEALTWMKTLKERSAELQRMRNENSASSTRHFGMHGDKEVTTTPLYDVKALDKVVNGLAREIRILDTKIKAANAIAKVTGYEINEDVLGELA